MDLRLINAAIDRALMGPMVWGVDDCCLWVCDLIAAQTGVDLAAPLRGYSSRLGAARKLREFAAGGLPEAAIKIARQHGCKPAGKPYGGDLWAVVVTPAGVGLAVWHGSGWLGRTADGVGVVPPWQAVLVWRFPSCRS